MVDQQCRESKGKAKIEGYMSISDEEAHHRISEEKSKTNSKTKELSGERVDLDQFVRVK